MRHTHSADLPHPKVSTRSFASLSTRLRPSVLALTVLIWGIGGAARAEWRPPTSGETALFVASQVAVLADLRTTLDIKNHPGGFEKNPILGRHPSDAKILALGGLSMAVQAATWYALPSPWRNVLSGVMLTVEIGMVA